MKISYKHLLDSIQCAPDIDELSNKLFQLGHENHIEGDCIEIEITPNRGDCLSVKGILRDLNVFYSTNIFQEIYNGDIKEYHFDFENNSENDCSKISFMKIEIEDFIKPYQTKIDNYFKDLEINKNNFFTDISNFIAYETGQPIHCYDASKLNSKLILEHTDIECSFVNLFDNEVKLTDKNLVFKCNNEIVNLACSKETKSVIVECASFNSEAIIGKSIKYDIKSDAAYKFERGVDPLCHDYTLRRFAKIVDDHAHIKKIEIYSKTFKEFEENVIKFDAKKINKILGTDINDRSIINILSKLGCSIKKNLVHVPSHRNDLVTINDLAEEVARVRGYDNIKKESFIIPYQNFSKNIIEENIKSILSLNGFYEVINNPFSNEKNKQSIHVDNPLDSNKQFLRTHLKNSLLDNLLYNERRQKDSIKLYEISEIYNSNSPQKPKKVLGLIASGRVGKNYRDFSKKIDEKYISTFLLENFPGIQPKIEVIPRDKINSKSKNKIFYLEIEVSRFMELSSSISKSKINEFPSKFKRYQQISEFPSSYRDISFSVKDSKSYDKLQNFILNYKDTILKDVFVFDFFINEKNEEIKIGFRFIFQSDNKTITETDVSNVVNTIIKKALTLDNVTIPGL